MDASDREWTTEERKALYKVVRRLLDLGYFSWRSLLKEGLAIEAVGRGFEDNFRAGRISKKHAATLCRWLLHRHPDVMDGSGFENSVRSNEVGVSEFWQELLERYGEEKGIGLLSNYAFEQRARLWRKQEQQQQQRQDQQVQQRSWVDPRIAEYPLFQHFRYSLEVERPAYVIGFQEFRRVWRTIPLGDQLAEFVREPEAVLPQPFDHQYTYRDNPLVEETEIGVHEVAFLFVGEKLASQLSEMIDPLSVLMPDMLTAVAKKLSADGEIWWLRKRKIRFMIPYGGIRTNIPRD